MAFGAREGRPWAVVLVCRKRACGSADFSAEKGVGVRLWLLMLLLRHPAEERSTSFSSSAI